MKNAIDIINKGEYEYYGIRADRVNYSVGDTLANSHQWYQDPWEEWNEESESFEFIDTDDERYNPELGCWDAGELDGTCCLYVNADNIAKVLEEIKSYTHSGANNISLIAGDDAINGNDPGEIIIGNAVCLYKF